jgi:uracil-DNA glycosylase family 4
MRGVKKMKRPIDFIKRVHEKVRDCTLCDFYKNGKAYPWFGKHPKLIVVGEAPHVDEISEGTFFVGRSGKLLTDTLQSEAGMTRDDLIILNTVFCMPTPENGKRIGKPTPDAMASCFLKRTNLLDAIKREFGIDSILLLGAYPRQLFWGKMSGVTADCGKIEKMEILGGNSFKVLHCIHPSSCFYNPNNREIFVEAIRKIKSLLE